MDSLIRERCQKHELMDRLPRSIPLGLLTTNKRIAEKIFIRTCDLELEQTSDQRIWAFRKTARTIDGLQENIADLSRGKSEIGPQTLSGIGIQLARLIAC